MKVTCPACGHCHEAKPKKKFYSDDAKSILSHLNMISGKKFRQTKHSLEHIQARLNEGRTKQDCISVLDLKIKDKWFVENNNFNPQTIFRPGNFERYVNEKPAPNNDHLLKKANQQADNVQDAIRNLGSNVSVKFADPITASVVRVTFGGWFNLCKGQAIHFRRNFIAGYIELAKKR